MALSARIYDALDVLNVCRHKFEGIFDMHGVRTGSPEEVPAFLQKLQNDRYFAMDFWGLVASLEAMGDRVSEQQVRRTVMDCLCGEWLPNDDPAVAAINQLFDERVRERVESMPLKPLEGIAARAETVASKAAAASDAGLRIVEAKVEEPFVAPMVEKLPAVVEAEAVQQEYVAESVPEVEAREVEAVEREVEAVEVETESAWQDRPVVELGNVGTSSADHIEQVLSRLEMINLELKLHLDDIDSRVSRLEPHLEELKTQVVRSLGLAATVEASMRAVPAAEPQWVPEEIAAPIAEPQWADEETALDPAVPATNEARDEVAVEAAALRAPSEPRVGDDVWPAVDWVGKARSLRGVGTALGVAACLALILWLWGRPRTGVVAPVVARSAAPAAGPKEPPAKEPTASAVKAEVQAEVAAAISSAAAPDDSESAAGAETAKAPAKVRGAKADGYVAPPWTTWYDDKGRPASPDTKKPTDPASAVKGGGK